MLAHRRDEDLLRELEVPAVERAADEARPLDEVRERVEEVRVLLDRAPDLGGEGAGLLEDAPAADGVVGLDEGRAELREVVVDADDDDPARRERPVADVVRPRLDPEERERHDEAVEEADDGVDGPRSSCRPSPHRIIRGKDILATTRGIASARISDVKRPSTTFRDGDVLALRRSTTTSASTATPCAAAKPSAARVGRLLRRRRPSRGRPDGLDLVVVLDLGQVPQERTRRRRVE